MPPCTKCGQHFSKRIWIGDKLILAQNRKRCYNCSPYFKVKNENGDLTCQICKKSYTYKRASGNNRKCCSSCLVNARRKGLKAKMVKYKGGSCEICGYNKCEKALTFHHIDASTKKFNISGGHCRAWKKLKEELDKCALLCSNCHNELHAGFVSLNSPVRNRT